MTDSRVFYNVSTKEVVELRKERLPIADVTGYNSHRVQVFHQNLELPAGNMDIVNDWIRKGRSVTSYPLYGYGGRIVLESEKELEQQSVDKIGVLVTVDQLYGQEFVRRLDGYLRCGSYWCSLYTSVVKYAYDFPDMAAPVSNPSATWEEQVKDTVRNFSRDGEEVDGPWIPLRVLNCADWQSAAEKVAAGDLDAVPSNVNLRAKALMRLVENFVD